jgi:hypothetical protein
VSLFSSEPEEDAFRADEELDGVMVRVGVRRVE